MEIFIVEIFWKWYDGCTVECDDAVALLNSLRKALQIQCLCCSLMYAERTTSNLDRDLTHFLPAVVCKARFWHSTIQGPFCRGEQAVLGHSHSPHTCPSVRCCSGWVRERSCLLWRWSESRGIPASPPTLRKKPLHRCSPKVNEALRFCGSSVFLNEALSWPGLNI